MEYLWIGTCSASQTHSSNIQRWTPGHEKWEVLYTLKNIFSLRLSCVIHLVGGRDGKLFRKLALQRCHDLSLDKVGHVRRNLSGAMPVHLGVQPVHIAQRVCKRVRYLH